MLPFIRSDLVELTAYKPDSSNNTPEQSWNTEKKDQPDRLDTNESPYDLPSEIKQKLAWTFQKVIECNRYPDGGHQTLKEAIAEYVNESANLSSSAFTSANISVGNGSDELIRSLLIATCLGGEGSILVADPTFSMYAILAKTLGIPVVNVGRNESNFEIDLKAAQSAIETTHNPAIRLVFVVHPNSPTGNCLTAAEVTWLKSLPKEILVVIDEAYFEFSQTSLVGELLQHRNWIILRTFSKAFRLAAMRVGYCVGHTDAIAILEKVRLPYNIPSFSLISALVALQNRQLLLSSISQTLSERTKLITALRSHPTLEIIPSETNFIYLRFQPNTFQSAAGLKIINETLKNEGTLIRLLPGGLRITLGTPEENYRTLTRLQIALTKLE